MFFGSTLELDLWKVFIWLIVYFIYCWWRCPNAVLVDGGRYFLMRSADKPVHVEKNPASIAGTHVDTTGLKHIL